MYYEAFYSEVDANQREQKLKNYGKATTELYKKIGNSLGNVYDTRYRPRQKYKNENEVERFAFTTGQANEKNQSKRHSHILKNVRMSINTPGGWRVYPVRN